MFQEWQYNGNHYKAPVPESVVPYVRALGYDAAADFFLAAGGSEISLRTKALNADSQIAARLVGLDGSEALRREFSDRICTNIRIPIAGEFLARHFTGKGQSVASISRMIRRSNVAVRNALSATRFRVEASNADQ